MGRVGGAWKKKMAQRSFLRALKALKTVILLAFGPFESHFQKETNKVTSSHEYE